MSNLTLAQSEFERGLASCPVMAVLRGYTPSETVRLAELAWQIGITQVEVPIESADALPSLIAAVEAGVERQRPVGAGTIISREQLQQAHTAGAAYMVSPGLDPGIIEAARERSLPFLPGVATASEILVARRLGFTWIKAFPASLLGAGWFRAMRGPFPEIRFVATGGMNAANASEILRAGASVVGVSRSLDHPEEREELVRLIRSSQQAGSSADPAVAPAAGSFVVSPGNSAGSPDNPAVSPPTP